MRRLRKINNINEKIEYQIAKAIIDLTENNNSNKIEKLYNTIIEDCSDYCLYNGYVYRKIAINDDEINSLQSYGENDIMYSKKEVLDTVRNCIQTGKKQSCTYSYDSCKNFNPNIGGLNVIIGFECDEGLDILELIEEYKDKIDDIFKETKEHKYSEISNDLSLCLHSYSDENEIFCTVPDEFDIYDVGALNVDDMGDLISDEEIFSDEGVMF